MEDDKIIKLINHLMDNYETVSLEFADFRSFVVNEKNNMIENVKKLFS
jgi:hypothetical protein